MEEKQELDIEYFTHLKKTAVERRYGERSPLDWVTRTYDGLPPDHDHWDIHWLLHHYNEKETDQWSCSIHLQGCYDEPGATLRDMYYLPGRLVTQRSNDFTSFTSKIMWKPVPGFKPMCHNCIFKYFRCVDGGSHAQYWDPYTKRDHAFDQVYPIKFVHGSSLKSSRNKK